MVSCNRNHEDTDDDIDDALLCGSCDSNHEGVGGFQEFHQMEAVAGCTKYRLKSKIQNTNEIQNTSEIQNTGETPHILSTSPIAFPLSQK